MNTIPMNAGFVRPSYLILSLIAAPFVALAAYVAWLVVPIVLEEVVPEVVRAVTTSN
jgi:hypothetical protein